MAKDQFTGRSEGAQALPDSGSGAPGIELAPEQLSPEALQGLLEEFVSREGTDYGHADRSLASKVEDVRRQLEAGDARIVFDPESETASIVPTRALRERSPGSRGSRASGGRDGSGERESPD